MRTVSLEAVLGPFHTVPGYQSVKPSSSTGGSGAAAAGRD